MLNNSEGGICAVCKWILVSWKSPSGKKSTILSVHEMRTYDPGLDSGEPPSLMASVLCQHDICKVSVQFMKTNIACPWVASDYGSPCWCVPTQFCLVLGGSIYPKHMSQVRSSSKKIGLKPKNMLERNEILANHHFKVSLQSLQDHSHSPVTEIMGQYASSPATLTLAPVSGHTAVTGEFSCGKGWLDLNPWWHSYFCVKPLCICTKLIGGSLSLGPVTNPRHSTRLLWLAMTNPTAANAHGFSSPKPPKLKNHRSKTKPGQVLY